MALHWDDPAWKAEHLRKMAAGRARRAAEIQTVQDPNPTIVPVNDCLVRSRETATHEAHNLETAGSTPASATNLHEPPVDRWRANADSRLYACGCAVRIEAAQAFDMPAYCPLHGEALALKLLRQLYNALRVRNAGTGYIKGRCSACNIPHFQGKCLHKCCCHQVEVFLELIDAAPSEAPADGNHQER